MISLPACMFFGMLEKYHVFLIHDGVDFVHMLVDCVTFSLFNLYTYIPHIHTYAYSSIQTKIYTYLVILNMVRLGTDPDLINLVLSYFDELDLDKNGFLSYEEITQKADEMNDTFSAKVKTQRALHKDSAVAPEIYILNNDSKKPFAEDSVIDFDA